jgi:recombination protein RecR
MPSADPSRLTAIERLAQALRKLPGIGEKTAMRLTYFLLAASPVLARELGEALLRLREEVILCAECFNLTQSSPCAICRDPARTPTQVCVVEEPADVVSLETARTFRGRYHVLGGTLSALEGMGPEDLRIDGLLRRVEGGGVTEVILAVSATVDGQTTAHYLGDRLAGTGAAVTRPAHGLPVGGELNYLDDGTLGAALRARRPVA